MPKSYSLYKKSQEEDVKIGEDERLAVQFGK